MRRREWILPVVVGLAVGAGIWWIVPAPDEALEAQEDEDPTVPAVVAPFGHAPRLQGDSVLWIFGDGSPTPGPGDGPTRRAHCVAEATHQGIFLWLNASADCPTPGGPRLMEGGHDAVRLSAYAFLADGTLAASSEDDLRSGRFPRSSEYVRLPDHTWYLGAGPPPEGTTAPPPALEETYSLLWPLLAGAPEGGIRSTVLEQHPHAWSTGPLWVTVRVDAVVSTES